MGKKLVVNEYHITDLSYDDIALLYSDWELQIILMCEPYTEETDNILDSMLKYYLMIEKYDFCCVIRDEIKKRDLAYELIGMK